MPITYETCGAQLSACGQFRYRLWRIWASERKRVLWVMLNPSTADASIDDQTIRTIVGISHAKGYGGIEVVNLFAHRATSPKELKAAGYPVGPDNDTVIRAVAKSVSEEGGDVVLAWGANATQSRAKAVFDALNAWDFYRLPLRLDSGLTKAGHPRHPLYHAHDTPFTECT